METAELRIPHYVHRVINRMQTGRLLVRQCSASEEAVEKGDGHLYFTHPDGKPVGTASGDFLVKNGLVEPAGDALFPDDSQTWRLRAA